jgi:hypothetical protein
MPSPAQTTSTRIEHLETAVSNVAVSLDGFIRETRDHRDRLDKDQASIWAAIRDQGENLSRAVDKLSSKGQISWGMIMTAVGTLLGVGAAVATVGQMLMESRIKQLEIADTSTLKLMEAKLDTHEVKDEALHELGRENHAAIRVLEQGK